MCSISAGAGGAAAGTLPDALGGIDTMLGALAGDARNHVGDLPHSDLAHTLTLLRAVQARCDALLLATIAEVDTRGTFTLDGALTTAAWLRATIRATPGTATRLARTARVLRAGTLPNTQAALAAGAFGASHAAVIADGVTGAPPEAVALIEPEVVAVAAEADERATANVMRAFRHALDPDAADEAAIKRYHRAGITLSPTLDGTFYLRGTADETTGALIADAINHASPLVTGDTRTAARRRLDGLADMCRHYLDHPDTVNAGPTGRRRTQLILTTDPTVFTTPAADVTAGNTGDAGADTDTDTVDTAGTAGTAADAADDGAEVAGAGCPGATLSWAGWITAATARRAACDSHTTFVSLGPDGDVVEAGTQRRFFTPAQRRAIIARDGDRCPAPYCDRPITWSDAHHLTPVEQGGPTTITNGALPCEAHHLMLHEGHWQLHRHPDGRYHLTNPTTGATLGPEPHPPGHNRPPPRRE